MDDPLTKIEPTELNHTMPYNVALESFTFEPFFQHMKPWNQFLQKILTLPKSQKRWSMNLTRLRLIGSELVKISSGKCCKLAHLKINKNNSLHFPASACDWSPTTKVKILYEKYFLFIFILHTLKFYGWKI